MLTYVVPITGTGASIQTIDSSIINSNQSNIHIWCTSSFQLSSQVIGCDYITVPANQLLAMPNVNSIDDILFRTVSGSANLNIIIYNAIS